MDELEKVRNELKKYLHPLLDFSVRNNNGKIELVIDLKNKPPDIRIIWRFTLGSSKAASSRGRSSA